ncbi:hypothetical protein CHS0354_024677 [Potamilus streckersoni]|uniref:Mitochondrial ribosome-associated GTPase 2 n=1 Tax=Potamilus streckersoni TaxID=2493646 RepID=A0AAE0VLE5_9BIVA|nr:hypothetical protein CHS0354_024677 [Potamilus streckersoni]
MGAPLSYSQLQWLRSSLKISLRIFHSYTAKPLKPHKPKAAGNQTEKFLDFKRVQISGGNGGDGMMCFSSLYKKEFAGPDGGDGGNGGHVIVSASRSKKSLNHVPSIIKAEDGEKGKSKNCYGKNAEHIYIEVPVGTVIKDEFQQDIASLDSEGNYVVVARGGAGGKGNRFFLSNEVRAPAYAEMGAEGEKKTVYLELKTMAHAGLIGFPNAGKSTLLRAISRARPKVAAYPFTTLNPHVGMVVYDDFEQIAVADIPGLIPDAHKNRGLGIAFLRHIERCTCLLYVIDLSVDDPWIQLDSLKFELEQYKEGLSRRPHAVIGNKIDLPNAEKNLKELEERIDLPVFAVSAKNKLNIEPVLYHIRELYDKYSQKKGAGW